MTVAGIDEGKPVASEIRGEGPEGRSNREAGAGVKLGHLVCWKSYVRHWPRDKEMKRDRVVVAEEPSSRHPEENHQMEIIDLQDAIEKTIAIRNFR